MYLCILLCLLITCEAAPADRPAPEEAQPAAPDEAQPVAPDEAQPVAPDEAQPDVRRIPRITWNVDLPEDCRHGSLGGLRDEFNRRNPGFSASTRGPRDGDPYPKGEGYWKLVITGPDDDALYELAYLDALAYLRISGRSREAQDPQTIRPTRAGIRRM